jgi:hypothetical protein
LSELLLRQLQDVELAHLLILSIRRAFRPVVRGGRREGARYLLSGEEGGASHC